MGWLMTEFANVLIALVGIDGYWIAEVPWLPGCVSQDKTAAEARRNVREAIELYLDDSNSPSYVSAAAT